MLKKSPALKNKVFSSLEKAAPMLKRAKLTEREYNLNAGLYAYINSRHVAFDFLEARKMVKDCLLLE